MPLFGRKRDAPPAPDAEHAAPRVAQRSWSEISSIRDEWPRERLDVDTQLRDWHQAQTLYENDDYASMMRCAELYASALAHSLYGPPVLKGSDFPDTVFRTMFCALATPPDGQTFAETAQRAARLALTLVRENGWQPKHLGGDGAIPEQFMMDKGNYLLLSNAIGPPGRPWEGDLRAFFAVPPEPVSVSISTSHVGTRVVDEVFDTMKQAEQGDAASERFMRGLALAGAGRHEEALQAFSAAAGLGSVMAMKGAGDVLHEMGRDRDAQFWYDSAAAAGHPIAMFNAGVDCWQAGDLAGC